MQNTKRIKNMMMFTLCVIVCIMSIAYALLATNLVSAKHKETSNNLYWNVGIIDISEAGIVGEAKSLTPPTNTTTNAAFNVYLKKPGDSITYKVTVRNGGQLNAKVHSIYAITTGNIGIEYKLSGINLGDKLAIGKEDELYIKITYKSGSATNNNKSRNITVIINYIQDL